MKYLAHFPQNLVIMLLHVTPQTFKEKFFFVSLIYNLAPSQFALNGLGLINPPVLIFLFVKKCQVQTLPSLLLYPTILRLKRNLFLNERNLPISHGFLSQNLDLLIAQHSGTTDPVPFQKHHLNL